MKSILVPTDFSDCAKYASDAALKFAQKSGATLHFMHLLDVPVDWFYTGAGMDEHYPDVNKRVKQAQRKLDALQETAEKAGVKAKVNIEYNHSYKMMLKYADQHNIDLIIMGSHGASGLKELFIGSNTQRVVRSSAAPVLVIKQPLEDFDIKNIVLAYDFESDARIPLKKIAGFAGPLKAKLHLVYISTPANFMETSEVKPRMEHYLSEAPQLISSTNMYNSLSFEKGLLNFCKEKDGDMIIMLTYGRKGISRFLTSSVTERVINHVDIPVMSMNILPDYE